MGLLESEKGGRHGLHGLSWNQECSFWDKIAIGSIVLSRFD